MADTPEGKLKKRIRALLQERGIWHYVAAQGMYSTHGIPDLMCCWHGRLLAVEVKAPGKRRNTTPNQERALAAIAAAGGIALVCDDLTQIKEILDAGPRQAAGCHTAAEKARESHRDHTDCQSPDSPRKTARRRAASA